MRSRMKELGIKTVPALARRMGKGDDQPTIDRLRKYLKGKVEQPRGRALAELAGALEMTEHELRFGGKSKTLPLKAGWRAAIRTLGEVAANVWRGVDADDQARFEEEKSALPADPRFPADAQYDLVVRGTSINRVVPDGFRLRVLNLQKTGGEAPNGELVIVQRTRDQGQIVETSAKRLRRLPNGAVELWPDSDDPRWQTPLRLGEDPDREVVEVVGWVLYAYQKTGAAR